MSTYPHMCRDGHVEIGHRDSEDEMCPLCREVVKVATLTEALVELLGLGRKDHSNPKYDGYYEFARTALAAIRKVDER